MIFVFDGGCSPLVRDCREKERSSLGWRASCFSREGEGYLVTLPSFCVFFRFFIPFMLCSSVLPTFFCFKILSATFHSSQGWLFIFICFFSLKPTDQLLLLADFSFPSPNNQAARVTVELPSWPFSHLDTAGVGLH